MTNCGIYTVNVLFFIALACYWLNGNSAETTVTASVAAHKIVFQ